MKILVLGAGATGGYFGARLLQAGADISFLVRPRRAVQLANDGLVVRSPLGDATLRAPTVERERLTPVYDIVLLTCKAFDLDDAIESIRPAVGPSTGVLPLLNGMKHLDRLRAAFAPANVLGGTCHIASTLSPAGEILHLNALQRIRFGELDRRPSGRVSALAEAFASTQVDAAPSEDIVQEMWEKWILLAALAASTCTLRAAVGDILEADDGMSLMSSALADCARIAAAEGSPPRPESLELPRRLLTEHGSTFTASMLRDLERRSERIESDQIVGDMLARGRRNGIEPPLLVIANTHLQAYLARIRREGSTG